MIKSYILNTLVYEIDVGTLVFDCVKPDYGISSDDTYHTGIEHISITLSAYGDCPCYSVPIDYLDDVTIKTNSWNMS